MGIFSTLAALVAALPDILKLIQAVQKAIDAANAEKAEGDKKLKIADGIKTIHGAFDENDASKLDDLFRAK